MDEIKCLQKYKKTARLLDKPSTAIDSLRYGQRLTDAHNEITGGAEAHTLP